MRRRSQVSLLASLNRLRLAGSARHPNAAIIIGVTLPLLVIVSALWIIGSIGSPLQADAGPSATIGLVVSGTLSFLAYGVLFGGGDDLFLSHVGIRAAPWYLERSSRLAIAGVLTVSALLVPYVAAGAPIAAPLMIGSTAGALATGGASLMYAMAARATVGGSSALGAGIRQFDASLAKAAPLVYAPLLPFLAGSFGAAAASSLPSFRLAIALGSVVAGAAAVALGVRRFAPVGGRFLPRASEMKFAPPPESKGEVFRVGRGLSALLPRRAAAVWVRDAAVAGRRFGWAARVSWPIVIVSFVALARWGDSAPTRAWVATAVGIALVIQSGAVVGLGLLERSGPRWIDRSAGARWWERFLGRWAYSWGLSLWLLVPVALPWAWWSGAPGAWAWPLLGALSAAVATTASLLNAERR